MRESQGIHEAISSETTTTTYPSTTMRRFSPWHCAKATTALSLSSNKTNNGASNIRLQCCQQQQQQEQPSPPVRPLPRRQARQPRPRQPWRRGSVMKGLLSTTLVVPCVRRSPLAPPPPRRRRSHHGLTPARDAAARRLNDKAIDLLTRTTEDRQKGRRRHTQQKLRKAPILARKLLHRALEQIDSHEFSYSSWRRTMSLWEEPPSDVRKPQEQEQHCHGTSGTTSLLLVEDCTLDTVEDEEEGSSSSLSSSSSSSTSPYIRCIHDLLDNDSIVLEQSSSSSLSSSSSTSSSPCRSKPPSHEYDEGMDPFSALLRIPTTDDDTTRIRFVMGTILFNLARVAHQHHHDQVALRYYQRAQEALEEEEHEESPVGRGQPNHLKVAICTGLGYLCYSQASSVECAGAGAPGGGNHHLDALSFYTTAANMTLALHGPHSLEAASCWNCLGVVYYSMCSTSSEYLVKAMDALQQSLRIRRTLLGEDHPDTATTWNNLGRLYYIQDMYEDALTAYRHALRIRRQAAAATTTTTTSGTSADVAATMFNLGQVYHQMREYQDAFAYYRQFMKMAKALFGVYHRDVCIVTSCIGQLLHSTKEYAAALKTYQYTLTISRQVFGDVNVEIAVIYNKMGNLYYDTGDLDAALQAYQKGLIVDRQLMDTGEADAPNVNIHVTYSNIVEIYKQRSEFDQALSYCQEWLEIQYKAKPEEIANTLSAMASIYHQQGKYNQALEVHQECLELWRGIKAAANDSGDDDDDDDDDDDSVDESIASALFHTALDLIKLDRSAMALDSLLEAYRIRKSLGNGDSLQLASVTYNIGLLHHLQGSHELALLYYQETAQIEQALLGSSHRDLSITLYNLGQIYYLRGDLESSLKHFRQALSMELECCGKNHSTCARTWMEIGNIELQLGNVDGLMEAFSEALRIYQREDTTTTSTNEAVVEVDRFAVYGLELWRFETVQPPAACVA